MSDDEAAAEHLRARLDLVTSSRDKEAAKDAADIKLKAAVAGRLASGNTVSQLQEQAVEDLRIRSEMFVQALGATWAAYSPGAHTFARAQSIIKEELQRTIEAKDRTLRSQVPSLGLGDLPESVWSQFRDGAALVEKRLSLGLREWQLQQERRSQQIAGSTQNTTVNLNGNNNMVVAGLMGSSVSLQLDGPGTERIVAALDRVKSDILNTRSLSDDDSRDVIELIDDARQEVERTQPNKKKLAVSLQGVATTIQTVGALGEAYGILKAAMALIGLPLP